MSSTTPRSSTGCAPGQSCRRRPRLSCTSSSGKSDWLGGKDNYPVDREAGEQFVKVYPGIVAEARANRQFLTRAIHYLVTEADIDQFLDIGTGLPTLDNTHEVSQRLNPASRIVYVDSDPLLMLQDGTAISQENAEALEDYNESGAVSYNLRTPEQIAAFVDGLELVAPGVVPIQLWRPDVTPTDPKDHVNTFGGIGFKR